MPDSRFPSLTHCLVNPSPSVNMTFAIGPRPLPKAVRIYSRKKKGGGSENQSITIGRIGLTADDESLQSEEEEM